ncbi:arylsulfatase [Lacticaseibacillus rhamnosus MTCC 5462]|nr:arylsulfatase [Lacticaseibacillus rhamnosus MTCC 5462]
MHIPSFIYDPGNLIAANEHKIKQLIKIQDIFPSIVDLAVGKKVKTDGKSVRQLTFWGL